MILLNSLLPILTCAIEEKHKIIYSFSEVANNLLIPVTIVSGFLAASSLIIGISFLCASAIRFRQRRFNYMAHPLSTVLTLFILGILLMLLPLIYHLTESGIPTSFYY